MKRYRLWSLLLLLLELGQQKFEVQLAGLLLERQESLLVSLRVAVNLEEEQEMKRK